MRPTRPLLRVASPPSVDTQPLTGHVCCLCPDATYVTSGKGAAAKSPGAPPAGLVSKRVASYDNYFSDLPTHPKTEVVRHVCWFSAPRLRERQGQRCEHRPRVWFVD